MKLSASFPFVSTILLSCVVTNVYAADLLTSSAYHHFLASNSTITVSNKDRKLSYSENDGKDWKDVNGNCTADIEKSNKKDSQGTILYTAKLVNSVKYIPETKLFVAVGVFAFPGVFVDRIGRQSYYQIGTPWFCMSPDGINWSGYEAGPRPSANNSYSNHVNSFSDIVYAKGSYVAVGRQLRDSKVTLPEPETRALVKFIDSSNIKAQQGTLLVKDPDSFDGDQPINSVVFTGDKLVAAANKSTIYLISPPGVSEKTPEVKGLDGKADFTQIIYVDDPSFKGKNKLVVIADRSTSWFSTDGVNWTVGNGLRGSAKFNQIAYLKNMFVIAADSNTIWASTDGKSWEMGNDLSGRDNLNQITHSNGSFKAIGDTGSAWYSKDALKWYK